MKSVRLSAWLAVFLGTVLTGSIAGVSGGQPVELNIQMIPGIWISGAAGAVNIEYTTNLDQTSGWALLATVQATSSPYFYIDASATNSPKRFYRAVVEGGGDTNAPTGMVWIGPGTFTMGSPSTEQDRYFDEGPQTQVTISRGFWMSKYETTQEEYQSVMGSNPSYFTGDSKRPVETVSWDDASNYCDKLTAREGAAGRLLLGYVYRLPTEAEWEYACRAETTTRYGYGDDPDYTQLGDYAWHTGNSGDKTHPVGVKKPNAWGLYDMHGNVWEWCLDWYGSYPGGSVSDPRGPITGSVCVFRGGSWYGIGWGCRTAGRDYYSSSYKGSTVGFRPVLAQVWNESTNTPPGMVWIAPGTFTMGSPLTEVDRYDGEGPQTQVTISRGFWMSKYETTQGEYLAVMGSNPSRFKGNDNRPVEALGWNDATNYCAKLTVREIATGRLPTGYKYRLPTEAEWEYACRAGTTTATAYGDGLSSAQANFNGEYPYGGAAPGPYLRTTTEVGAYAPNAWGLYDMHGNVSEWCLDWVSNALPGGSILDPRGRSEGSDRVNRGGCWRDSGMDCRSACRYDRVWPDATPPALGFRPVLAPGQ